MKIKAPALNKIALPKLNLPQVDFRQLAEDFRTLDPKDPGMWPPIPRAIILVSIFLLLLLLAWWFGWNTQIESLTAKEQEEVKLKEEWLSKKRQAVNLDEYRKQLVDIDRSFGVLLKQLPNKSEMESLLIDINQAGLGRGLQFEYFKPNPEVVKGFYAELPITLKVTGSYHDLGAFAGDVAKMPRIVTLNEIDISENAAGKDAGAKDKAEKSAAAGTVGTLFMSATAKTFRYLDDEEMAKLKKEKEKAKAASAAPAAPAAGGHGGKK
jgi:type IV pilus assembly protein PilO